MFFLVWGFKVRFKTVLQGAFFCPTCGGDRPFEQKQGRRWFTLFWIPVIPLKEVGEQFVECSTCRQAYKTSVLQLPTSANLSNDLTVATREATTWLLRSAPTVTPAARRHALDMLSGAASRPWSDAELDHDLGTLTVDGLPGRLTTLASVLNEHGRETFFSGCVRVAAANGSVGAAEQALLDSIASSLGMSPAHARGVIAQTLEQAAARAPGEAPGQASGQAWPQ
jgi:hypothetical protein